MVIIIPNIGNTTAIRMLMQVVGMSIMDNCLFEVIQWVCFGGDGVIAENVRDEQRKFIKYNHLVANLLTFHRLVTKTSALRQLLQEVHPADTEALATLSPYQTEHINRFGNYSLNPNRIPEPLEQHLQLGLE